MLWLISYVTWLIRLCDTTHLSVWHDSFVCVTRLIFLCDMTHFSVWHDSFFCMTSLVFCVTRLIRLCDMTFFCVTCVTWVRFIRRLYVPKYMWHVGYMCLHMQAFEAISNMTQWVMSHIWMSHVTHMNESCRTYEWVMSHIWMSHVAHICMSHVTHMNESCHSYGRVMSHIWMSHVAHMNESRHTSAWVIRYVEMSHVTHMDESCHICKSLHTYEYESSHIWMICEDLTWLIHMCDMTHSYVQHDSCIRLTLSSQIIHMCEDSYSYVRHDSFMCATWLIHMCDMTHVWHYLPRSYVSCYTFFVMGTVALYRVCPTGLR